MKNWNALGDEEFRADMARFIDGNCPPSLRNLRYRPRWAQQRDWYLALAADGRLAPNWPVRHGGMGLSPSKHMIYFEEMERFGAPRLIGQGIDNFGPLIIAHGTPEQQAGYLPKILSGEHVWCQGYSEPGAGSDLASLRTEARIDGGEFVVNGHKIWTSMAFDANRMFALVRTDRTKPRHAGISMIVIDMHQPGITVRPIENIAGDVEFCEVFLDDVRAPLGNLVGALHDGWRVATALLGFERITPATPRQSLAHLYRLEHVARASGLIDDAVFFGKFCALKMDVLDLTAAFRRLVADLEEGGQPGVEVSYMKVWATETAQRITELILETAGEHAGLDGTVRIGEEEIDIVTPFYNARVPTIYGGSSEIQRNILARRALGLPAEGRA